MTGLLGELYSLFIISIKYPFFHFPIFVSFLAYNLVAGLEAKQPETAEIYFDESFSIGLNTDQVLPAWIRGIEQDGGYFNTAEEFWSVAGSKETGAGWLALHIDRQHVATDLAMALMINDHENTDLAIQLFNSSGEVVAVDLFANVAESIRVAETDFLIIPLSKYEDAETVVVRRINGRVEVSGLILFPVISEVEADPETEQALLELLGDRPSKKYSRYLKRKIKESEEKASDEPDSGQSSSQSLPDPLLSESLDELASKLPFVLLKSDVFRITDIYFIPMEFPAGLAKKLAEDLEKELGIQIKVSVQMGTSPEMYVAERRQYNVNEILKEGRTVLKRIQYQEKTPFAIILTSMDINSPPYNLRFNFASHARGMSVVSTARMDNRNFGLPANSGLLYLRLKKMVKKAIGYGYYGYKRSLDRGSVMYSPIMGMQDLDEIGMDY